jgi:uncharacterized protein (TIGR02284 family)
MSTTAKIDDMIINLLDDLMTKDRDAAEGYIKASENVSNPEVKKMLMRFSQKRIDFVEGFKKEIDNLGGDYKDRTSVLSTMHRIWMDIRGTITGKDELVILNECLRGEEASLSDYADAAANDFLPESSKKIIEKHKSIVEKSIEELKSYVHQFEPAEASSK